MKVTLNENAEIVKNNPWVEGLNNVVLFRGDEKIATQVVLTEMGIVPEKIEEHSAEYTDRSPLQREYFKRIKESFGIEQEKHVYSPEYAEDDEKNLKLWKIYDYHFYNLLFSTYSDENFPIKESIDYLLSDYNTRTEKVEYLEKFILEIGLENYQQFVLDYNRKIVDAIKNHLYPNNDTILEREVISIDETIDEEKKM